MSGKELHPSVKKFKEFIKNNPNLLLEVREGTTTLQELYKEWYLLGEEDSRWERSADAKANKNEDSGKGESDWMGKIMGVLKKMDPEQFQGQIHNISQAIGAIQGVLAQFTGNQPQDGGAPNRPSHPFEFRKD